MDDNNSVVILPEGSKVPEDIREQAKIIGFVREDGSVLIEENGETTVFDNMSKFFKYVGSEGANE
tara:strand:+ start:1950 stop:2144 length:195 start_codon:yes stop_codon:yes gene_type:complete